MFFTYRNPNGLPSETINEWPLYRYPKREHIVLDVFNVSTGIAHRAGYCAFWENHIPMLLEEFGKYSSFPHSQYLENMLI